MMNKILLLFLRQFAEVCAQLETLLLLSSTKKEIWLNRWEEQIYFLISLLLRVGHFLTGPTCYSLLYITFLIHELGNKSRPSHYLTHDCKNEGPQREEN